MNTSIADINDIRKSIQFTFDASTIQTQEDTIARGFAKHARIHGFRPGKAPLEVVKKQYKEDIFSELNRELVKQAMQHAQDSLNLKIYDVVDIQSGLKDSAQPQTLTLVVDLVPEFNLPEYVGIDINVNDATVSEAEVDAFLNDLRRERATFDVVQRPAQKSDYVKIGYQGFENGKPLKDSVDLSPLYVGQTVTWEEVEAPEDTPCVRAISDGLVGMLPGESKEVVMNYPQDFKIQLLAGKSITYKVDVKEVREKKLPELDEAFLKPLKVNSVDELKERLKGILETRKNNQSHADKRSQVVDFLNKNITFTVPESAQEHEAQSLLDDIVHNYTAQGASEKVIKDNQEILVNQSKEGGMLRAKIQFILSKIAEVEKIETTEDEIKQAFIAECMQRKENPNKVIKEIQKDRTRINRLRKNVLLDKTLDFLVQKANLITHSAPSAK